MYVDRAQRVCDKTHHSRQPAVVHGIHSSGKRRAAGLRWDPAVSPVRMNGMMKLIMLTMLLMLLSADC